LNICNQSKALQEINIKIKVENYFLPVVLVSSICWQRSLEIMVTLPSSSLSLTVPKKQKNKWENLLLGGSSICSSTCLQILVLGESALF